MLTGLEAEARGLARALGLSRIEGLDFLAFGRSRMRVAAIGMGGRALEARWAVLVTGGRPARVVSAGVCGGLDPALACGELIVPEHVLGPQGEVLAVSSRLRRSLVDRLDRVGATGVLATSPEVLGTPGAKADLRARTGAGAVDMESAAIVRLAVAAGAPVLVVRAVSDAAGEVVPRRLAELVSFDGRVRARHALTTLALAPWLLPHALRLGWATRSALAAVASALAALATVEE